MSVFNDIEWKKKDDNCISNAEKSQKLHKEVSTRTLVNFSGSRFGKEMVRQFMWWTIRTVQPTKMAQQFKEIGHPIFTATSALSRGMLQQRKGKCTIHFNGDFHEHRCFCFKQIISVNQVSIYAVCYELVLQICFEEGKTRNTFLHPWIIELRLLWEAEELDMLMSSLNLAQGNLMMQEWAKEKLKLDNARVGERDLLHRSRRQRVFRNYQ